MSRFEDAKIQWQEILHQLQHNPEKLDSFFKFSGGIYKYSFEDAALIFKQNPTATMVAEFNVWQKLKRRIKFRTKSIAVFKNNSTCRYLFDIADTFGETPPKLWNMSNSSLQNSVTSAINKQYGVDFSDISSAISILMEDSIQRNNNEYQTNEELSKAFEYYVKKIVISRCELGSNFILDNSMPKGNDVFKALQTLEQSEFTEFCSIASATAKETLLSIEKTIVSIMNTRRNKQNEQFTNNNSGERNQVSAGRADGNIQPGNELHGERTGNEAVGTADTPLRTEMAGMDGSQLSVESSSSQNKVPLVDNSEGNRLGNRQNNRRAERTMEENTSASSDGISNITDMGETAVNVGRTADRKPRLSTQGVTKTTIKAAFSKAAFVMPENNMVSGEQLSIFGEIIPEKKEKAKTPLIIGNTNTVAALRDEVLSGSGFEDGKFRILAFAKKKPTTEEFAKFLAKEYGIGGHSCNGDIKWADHNGKGITLAIVDSDAEKGFTDITFSWKTVAHTIAELVLLNQYITEEDIENRIRSAKYAIENYDENDRKIEWANNVLDEYGVKYGTTTVVENGTEIDSSDEIVIPQIEKQLDIEIGDIVTIDDNKFRVESINKNPYGTRISMFDLQSSYPISRVMNVDELEQTEFSIQRDGIVLGVAQSENISEEIVLGVAQSEQKAENYRITALDVTGGPKVKYKHNIEAIQTLRKLQEENRTATADEQKILAEYVGWGGIPQAFDAGNSSWSEEYVELKSLLSDSEYALARESTLTSFYTSPEIISEMYRAFDNFGFTGGNVLEPSMGVGNFFGCMPAKLSNTTKLYGVELDTITGNIAKNLYPKANISVKGFEQTNFNDESFDIAIGNIPFGDYSLSDKRYNKHNFKIHDYFFAKTVDKLKTGGILAFITSKGTMDKKSSSFRKYIAERCDLLGAIRLPNSAFKSNAGTSATSDIIFIQKRETIPEQSPTWIDIAQNENGVPMNKYFIDHPEMILGTMEFDERMRGKYGENSNITTCIPFPDKDINQLLHNAIDNLNGKFQVVSKIELTTENEKEVISALPLVKNYTYTEVDGKLYFRENEIMTKVSESGKNLERLMALNNFRNLTMQVINAQVEGCSDKELEALQLKLNENYDSFVAKYGFINDSANNRCFKLDDDYNTLCAMEIVDKENNIVKKAPIFSERTVWADKPVTKVDTAIEALQVSLDRLGSVDIRFMADLCSMDADKMIDELGNMLYINPETHNENDKYTGFEESSAYLSGDIRKKLNIAKLYATTDNSYNRNVTALEASLPKPLTASEISVRIGTAWVDISDYNLFLQEYAQANTAGLYGHSVRRTRSGEYKIDGKIQDRSIAAITTFGTKRMNSYAIFENLLNQRDTVVKDRLEDENGNVTYILNKKETELATEKARKMKDAFKNWIWNTPERRSKYEERYNNLFNSIKGRDYDGSHQTFPGMSHSIELRPHQKNAIARAKYNGNTLLAHCVGAGKSFEMVAATMEKKRLGLINKACIVVPKHLTMQTASEWVRLYPLAKIMVATPDDFSKNNRQKFIARCVTGNYDAIIMSYEQFGKIPMSLEYREEFIKNELEEITLAISESKGDRASVKDLERERKNMQKRLDKLMSEDRDNSLSFEQLGFDYIVVDEAHNYKNCLVMSKMNNVSGVQNSPAQKSEDMLMKCRYMNEKYNYSNILFATGTPISNSMAELYTMQRYLRPDLFTNAQIYNFDDWASAFGEVVTQLEMKPAGDGFRMKKRFSKFVNLPELMQIFKEFADVQTSDMVKLDVPKMNTGKPQIVVAQPDLFQKAYMKELAERSERIHSGTVDPTEDNMLKITNEARLLGLDSRCIYPDCENNNESKVNLCIDNIMDIYRKTSEEKGAQIVFCDIGINSDGGKFSVYEYIKAELIRRGLPEKEISLAGDATTDEKRTQMFAQLRSGDKRIIIASTAKLGTGANVQTRLAALHHLDIPWRPSDLERAPVKAA